MTLRKLFEKQVFIRLTDDQTAFISTAKWLLLTRIRRVSVSERLDMTVLLKRRNRIGLLSRIFLYHGIIGLNEFG